MRETNITDQLRGKLNDCMLSKAFWEKGDIHEIHAELLDLRNKKSQWIGIDENDLRRSINRQLRTVGIYG